jgi:hypothetical protein
MPPRTTYRKRILKEEKYINVGSYTIQKYDIVNACKQPRCIVVLGQRNKGKSTLVREILTNIHILNIPRYVVFSKTEPSNGAYAEYGIPVSYIWTQWDEQALINIYNSQIKLQELKKQGVLPNDMEDTRLVLVVDDFGYDKKIWNAQIWQNIFMNGRHNKIYVIVILQYAMMIPPALRSQIDVLFMLNERAKRNIKTIHEQFVSMLTLSELEAMMTKLTQNFRAMIFDNTSTGSEIDSMIFFFKARTGLQNNVGSELYREMDLIFRGIKDSVDDEKENDEIHHNDSDIE